MKLFQTTPKGNSGFSLVELTIVVVILGVLSMMAVPRYQTAVERAKGAEAFTYMAQVAGAQERHNARSGQYANSLSKLDLKMTAPKHFSVGSFTSYNWQTKWELKLTRKGASSGFGNYTVCFDQNGFNRGRSSMKTDLIPVL
jgi:prepilin-type N-terminal cleavage/methylation domain-containing protein